MRTSIHIEPSVKPFFNEKHLLLADENPAGKVQRLAMADGSVFYVKRTGREKFRHHLRTLLLGHRPYSCALRELRVLQELRRAGFMTAEPVAWGERRRFGFPVNGALVVREVQGEEVSGLFERLDSAKKRVLMESTGLLVGKLHAAGFVQAVRLRDLIKTEQGLVLIDRATAKPWRSFFSRRKCISSLQRSVRRTLREGYHMGAGSTAAFLKGYRQGIAPRWRISPSKVFRRLVKAADSVSGKPGWL